MKRNNSSAGRMPPNPEFRLAKIVSIAGTSWAIWTRPKTDEGGWHNIHVASFGRPKDQGKASYALAWNGERYARSQDCDAIMATRQALFAAVAALAATLA